MEEATKPRDRYGEMFGVKTELGDPQVARLFLTFLKSARIGHSVRVEKTHRTRQEISTILETCDSDGSFATKNNVDAFDEDYEGKVNRVVEVHYSDRTRPDKLKLSWEDFVKYGKPTYVLHVSITDNYKIVRALDETLGNSFHNLSFLP